MASVLKVDKLDPQSGTALEIGSSGDPITIPSGATFTQSGTMNASAITAGTFADARISSGSVTQHVTDLRSDIMTLALKEAITENRVAYNLPNAMIEQFQDDSKIGTETDGDRNASEYWVTQTSSSSTLDLGTDFEVISSYQGGSSGSYATQSHENNTITMEADGSGNLNIGNMSGVGLTPVVGDVYVWTQTLQQVADGGGVPNFISIGVSINKQTEAYHHSVGSTLDQARSVFPGFDNASSVDDVIVTTITLGTLTGSGITISSALNGGSASTTRYVNGSNFDTTTLSATGLYFFHSAWIDEPGAWRIHTTCNKTSTTANATGTLISTAQTANAAQTKVSGVILYKNEEGTATLGTDLKIYFTCDGGSNWTESTPTAAGTFSSGILMAKCPEVTCTSGTDIRYKAVWANQSSGSKETQLHGIGVNY